MSASILPLRPLPARNIGPDAVRAFAALLVVYLHACAAYLTNPMPGLVWATQDQRSAACDSLFWAIEVFIMPLFLLLAGFYSWRSLANGSGGEFLLSRSRRLLRPLLFGVLMILPLDLYIWMLGMVGDGFMPLSKLRSLKVPAPQSDYLWGLSHLWFLLYAFTYSALLVGVRAVFGLKSWKLIWNKAAQVSIIGFSAAAILSLALAPEVVFGFQHSFLPNPSKWIYCGMFFAGGVALAVYDPHFYKINRNAARKLAFGMIATTAAVLLGRWTLAPDRALPEQSMASQWVPISLAIITVVAAWSVSLGLIGVANRWSPALQRSTTIAAAIRYLAEASLWIYLIHHPIVGLVQIDLKHLVPGLSPFAKSILVLAISSALAIASYETLIRRTRFGHWIGLTSKPPQQEPAQATEPSAVVSRPAIRIAA